MTIYDVIKPAIVTALTAIDSTMRVYDYKVNPADTRATSLFELFGVLDPITHQPPADPTKRVINMANFTRRRPGRYDKVHSTGPRDELRFGQSDWEIDLWASVQDPTISSLISTPSEYEFQEKLDQLARELFLNDAIIALMRPPYDVTILSVNISDCWFALMGETHWCHMATLTVTASHLMNKNTF